MSRIGTQTSIAAAIGLGLLLVGYIDYLVGIEIRTFSLYFLPLMLSAWLLDKRITAVFSLLASTVWAFAAYAAGQEHSHWHIWVLNFLTQSATFLLVSLLVSYLRDSNIRERALNRIDPLTGLLNRRSFYQQSETIIRLCHRKHRPITLAYLDLDNFKRANDTLGHDYGDTLLREVAHVFFQCLRATDMSSRVGGDEFVLLLPETSADAARPVLERIREKLADEPRFRACGVTVSIGAVSFLSPPATIQPMIRAADNFMYEVKTSTKNDVRIESLGQDRPEGAKLIERRQKRRTL